MFVSALQPRIKENIAKSMTIWKLCERSSKKNLAGFPNFIRLWMNIFRQQQEYNLSL